MIAHRTCTQCERRLPESSFFGAGSGKLRGNCNLCEYDNARLRTRLRPIPVDRDQVRLNNTFNLWHGPAQRAQLKASP
ncbi:hypothetical protein AB8810_10915 [Xanthomonas sp. NCPPB 3005]|uniref:hypothetical protein n=1 Tax=Xanthomonas sp. NCPPB 3005 TaxID=3240913 RepID=UPI003514167B